MRQAHSVPAAPRTASGKPAGAPPAGLARLELDGIRSTGFDAGGAGSDLAARVRFCGRSMVASRRPRRANPVGRSVIGDPARPRRSDSSLFQRPARRRRDRVSGAVRRGKEHGISAGRGKRAVLGGSAGGRAAAGWRWLVGIPAFGRHVDRREHAASRASLAAAAGPVSSPPVEPRLHAAMLLASW